MSAIQNDPRLGAIPIYPLRSTLMSNVSRPIRIVHVITGLSAGGAERTMINIARGLDPNRFQSQIVSISRDHTLEPAIRAAGLRLTTLDARPFRSLGIAPVRQIAELLRREKPDLVQTWLFDADLLGGIAAWMTGVPVIWNVRASLSDSGWIPLASSLRLRAAARLCAAMSGIVPRHIVSCSRANVSRNLRHYKQEKIRVISNGVDVERFKPDPVARAEVRAELGVGDRTPLVGMVSRFHPVKDFATFFAAARSVIETHPHVRFLLCGQGMEQTNAALTRLIRSHGLEASVLRIGFREDVARVFAALDIHVLASKSEAFSNVLLEAMAAGVPSVATDAGEAQLVVGDAGRIVPRRNPAALASGIRELIDLPCAEMEALRARARRRVVCDFTLAAAIERYAELYEDAVRV